MLPSGVVVIGTHIDTTGLKGGMKNIEKSFQSLSRNLLKLVGIGGFIAGIKTATTAASELQEAANVVNVSFAELKDQMYAFADVAIDAFGISRVEAESAASSFMAMGRGMGIAMQSAANMALNLTALSSDMASFYNVTLPEAIKAIESIYTGETETIKRYGIILNETNLTEYAQSLGIQKSISAMTQKEKVLLRYNYVLKRLELAEGDFQRTQENFANQLRVLKQRWVELLTAIGEYTLDIFTPIIKGMSQVISYAIYIMNILRDLLGVQVEADDTTTSLTESVSDLGDELQEAAKKASHVLAPFDKLNNLVFTSKKDKGLDDDISALFGEVGLINSVRNALSGTLENTSTLTEEIKENLRDIALKIASVMRVTKALWRTVKQLFKWGNVKEAGKAFSHLADYITELLSDALVEGVSAGWEKVNEFLQGMLSVRSLWLGALGLANLVKHPLLTVILGALFGEDYGATINNFFNNMLSYIDKGIELLKLNGPIYAKNIANFFDELNPFEMIQGFITTLKDGVIALLNIAKFIRDEYTDDELKAIGENVSDTFATMFDSITEVIESVDYKDTGNVFVNIIEGFDDRKVIRSIAGTIKAIFKAALDFAFRSDLFNTITDKIVSTANYISIHKQEIVDKITDNLEETFDGVDIIDAILKALFVAESIGSAIIDLIAEGISRMTTEDWQDVGQRIFTGLKGAIDWVTEQIKKFDWFNIGIGIGAATEEIGSFISSVAKLIKEVLVAAIQVIGGISLQNPLATLLIAGFSAIKASAVLTGSIGKSIGTLLTASVATIKVGTIGLGAALAGLIYYELTNEDSWLSKEADKEADKWEKIAKENKDSFLGKILKATTVSKEDMERLQKEIDEQQEKEKLDLSEMGYFKWAKKEIEEAWNKLKGIFIKDEGASNAELTKEEKAKVKRMAKDYAESFGLTYKEAYRRALNDYLVNGESSVYKVSMIDSDIGKQLIGDVLENFKTTTEDSQTIKSLNETGSNIVEPIIDGMTETSETDIPVVTNNLKALVSNGSAISFDIKDGTSSETKKIGKAIASGFSNGITLQLNSDIPTVNSKFKSLVVNGSAIAFNIKNNTSGVTKTTGEAIAKGLGDGLTSKQSDLTTATSTMMSTVQSTIDTGVSGITNSLNNMFSAVDISKGANSILADYEKFINGMGKGDTKLATLALSNLTPEGNIDWSLVKKNSTWSNLHIPKLATGAVLPPNKPFAAIVGDQKSGTNVEAPLDVIKQALKEVLGNQQVNVTFDVQGDPERIFSVVQREANNYNRRTGSRAFGGA